MSIILDNLVNEKYEPSEEELIEYGKWLGMKFPDDYSFLWIAREGLKAPLPEGWKACKSEKGDLYYFNIKTGESMWDHPLDNQFKELLQKEKENPSPKSLANGAKKSLSQTDKMGEHIIKAAKQNEQHPILLEGKSKIGALKSLKLKKLSPNVLSPESAEENKPCFAYRDDDIDALKPSKVLHVKNNSMLKPITNTLPTEGSGGLLNMEKNAYEVKLNKDLKVFQTEKLKQHQIEKEEYEMKLKDSWDRFQKQLKDEYDKKYNQLKEDYERKFLDEKRKMEERHAGNIQTFSNEVAIKYDDETARIRQAFAEKFEKEKLEIEQMYQADVENFRKNKCEEVKKLCASERQILESMKLCNKELADSSSVFVETYKNAHDEFISVLINTNTIHQGFCKMTLDHFIDCTKNLYESEIKNIKDFFQVEVDQLRQKFTAEMCTLQREHSPLIKKQDKCGIEFYEAYDNQGAEKNVKNATISVGCLTQSEEDDHEKDDHAEMSNRPISFASEANCEGACCVDTFAGAPAENDLLAYLVKLIKENQKKDMEDVKNDLKRSVDEEMKAVLEEVVRGRHNELSASVPDKMDETHPFERLGEGVSFRPSTEERQLEREKLTHNSDTFQGQNLKTALTEALRAVLASPSFIVPSTPTCSAAVSAARAAVSTTGKLSYNAETILTPSATETRTVDLERQVDVFPVSLQDQKTLLTDERRRVEEVKKFVESQRLSLEERRRQFKLARHQWKQDVMAAKLEGVRPSSKRGQLLNKLRTILDNQAKALENDETILRDTENWLFVKKQNIQKMEQYIRELDEGKGRDMSFNSLDTVGLMTGFFGSTAPSAPSFKTKNQDIVKGNAYKENLNLIYTKTLERIAKRLEEVKTLMNNQQQKRKVF